MFCSACAPAEEPLAATTATEPGSEPPLTALPLRLIATQKSDEPAYSSATIADPRTSQVGAFRPGDEVAAGVELATVDRAYVHIRVAAADGASARIERLELAAAAPPPAAAPAAKPAKKSRGKRKRERKDPRAKLLAEITAGIQATSENTYNVERKVVDTFLANPQAMRGARIRPAVEGGRTVGFKLTRLRRNSAFRALGLQRGDIIHSVNGLELTSADKALSAYTRVREASNIRVAITRAGQQLTLEYNIQ
jgi:general secretion pathway protein C